MTIDIGRVTSVEPSPDEKRVYVSVKISPEEYHEDILFATGQAGLWVVPSEGDIVEVYEVGTEMYVARTPHNPTPFTMPEMGEGDFCLRLNENTELFFQKQDDDTFNIDLESDGEVRINGSLAAREGDTVEVESDLEGTLTGTITSGADSN